MGDAVETWERAAAPDPSARPGVPTHRRGAALAASTPAARVIELTSALEQTRQYLSAACAEVRRLRGAPGAPGPDRFHSLRDASFAGVPMAQYLVDLYLWESILNTASPPPRAILEVGTWQGGLSLWLHAQAQARGMQFRTWDAVAPEREIPGFERLDVFASPEAVTDLMAAFRPVVLLCDGGNKPRELRTFGPHLGPGDLLVVHDWGSETLPSDVPECLEEVYGDFCDELGSLSRVFRAQ